MSWGRYFFSLGVGAVAYIVLTYFLKDGPLLSGSNVRQFIIIMIVTAITLSQQGRRAATPRAIIFVGLFFFVFLGAGMLYLTYPFDTLDAVLPALFVMLFPSAMIGMGVWQLRRRR
jgi:hypothetical protein